MNLVVLYLSTDTSQPLRVMLGSQTITSTSTITATGALAKRLYNNIRAVPATSVAATSNVPSDTTTTSDTLTTVVAVLNTKSNMVLFKGNANSLYILMIARRCDVLGRCVY